MAYFHCLAEILLCVAANILIGWCLVGDHVPMRSPELYKQQPVNVSGWSSNLQYSRIALTIWRCPKMGDPPKHPIWVAIFHYVPLLNHPALGVGCELFRLRLLRVSRTHRIGGFHETAQCRASQLCLDLGAEIEISPNQTWGAMGYQSHGQCSGCKVLLRSCCPFFWTKTKSCSISKHLL